MKYRMLTFRAFLIARITCMFPCLCAQGSSIGEYLDFSRIAVKRDTCVLVCLYALRGFHTPKLHLNVVAELPGILYPVCFTFVKVTGVFLRYTSPL